MPNLITLDMNHHAVQQLCKKDKRLAKVIEMVGTIQYTPHDEDAYSFLIHEIIEQMLSDIFIYILPLISGSFQEIFSIHANFEQLFEISRKIFEQWVRNVELSFPHSKRAHQQIRQLAPFLPQVGQAQPSSAKWVDLCIFCPSFFGLAASYNKKTHSILDFLGFLI